MRTWPALLGLLLAGVRAGAQTYDLSWHTVDGGGATFSSGGSFELGATLGQPDAGSLAGAPYLLAGGFWAATLAPQGAVSDLAITKTDSQAAAVPGQSVTYVIAVTNAGPDDAVGALVSDVPPPALLGVSWACAPTAGSTCSASGTGSIDDTVTILAGGELTYNLSGTIDPAATGVLANTASATAPGLDPDPTDNSATDTDTLAPETNLGVALADSPDPVGQGKALTYAATVSSAGPSASSGSALALTLPPEVTFVSSIPGQPDCVHAGGTVSCTLGPLAPGGATVVTVTATVGAGALGPIGASASLTPNEPDPVGGNDTDAETTTVVLAPEGELIHGTRQRAVLAALPGPAADEHRYRIHQKPMSSYEVVVDEASGDLGTGSGVSLERVASDGATVLQSSQPIGTGRARSLRWENTSSSAVVNETVRVASQSCTTDCGAEDGYRIRAWDTTCAAPRFNNSATQLTILVLQNTAEVPVAGHVFFWDASGALLQATDFSLGPRGLLSLNTATLPGLPGASGSVTVTHDGRYGELAGKAVAVEPATGFTFDSVLQPRPR